MEIEAFGSCLWSLDFIWETEPLMKLQTKNVLRAFLSAAKVLHPLKEAETTLG